MGAELERIARRCQEAFGPLDREEARIALCVFRELAAGRPATGTVVEMDVTPAGIRNLAPSESVLSFVDPERLNVEKDRIVTSFCHHVHFFASSEAREAWAAGRAVPSFELSVEEGWELGRLVNRMRYGDLLGTPAG